MNQSITYPCVVCGKEFHYSLLLEFHYDISHTSNLYQCDHCFNSYATLLELFHHFANYHDESIYDVFMYSNLYQTMQNGTNQCE